MSRAKLIPILKRILKKYKMTQKELADRLGVYPETVNRWVNGKTEISKVFKTIIEKKLEREIMEVTK